MHFLQEIKQIWGGDSFNFSLNPSESLCTIAGLQKQIDNLQPHEDTIQVAIPLTNITTDIKRIKIK